ncbi:MAG: hypothetical protein JHC74_00450 [Thermoleophilia bacterium]|nr:hypothetical protein [Thermoleophilia bacterium]
MTDRAQEVTFQFRLRGGSWGVGWADARLEVGGNVVEMGPSYVTDALGDLLRAGVALTQGAPDVSLSWNEEGLWVHWWFALQAERVRLRVEFQREDGSAPQEQLSGIVRLDALVRVVVCEARAVFDEHGEEGYLDRWGLHPFPVAELRALEDWPTSNP